MRISVYFLLATLTVAASSQVLETKTYSTTGHPFQAIETEDGQYVLVTVTSKSRSGIDVFRVEGSSLKRTAFQPLGPTVAQGILIVPQTKILAVGMSNAGVAFLPLGDALKGTATPEFLSQGEQAGSGALAATPDGQTLFVANEYGDGGNVGVIALHRDEHGLHPQNVVHVPAGRATPGVTVSADGTRLYAVGELVPPQFADKLPGHEVHELRHDGCTQATTKSMPNGALYVMDAKKLEALSPNPDRDAIRPSRVGWTNAGCSPVRVALNDDSSLVYVTARGDDRVLVFDAKALATEGAAALVTSFASGDSAPVGLKLFDGGKMLLVANSNRFNGGDGSAAVIDVSDVKKTKLKQKIRTGKFPRNISASSDGKRLYLTIFLGDELMVLTAH